ncbi:heavy-metal-associated domain-containing protein [Chitinophaga lutea]
MKKILLAAFALLGTTAAFAQSGKDSLKVYGNCNMCKKRIEKAAKTDGVTAATWNVQTKMLQLTFDPAKTSADAVARKIAAAGHDSDKHKAQDSVYNALPGCCQYDRSGKPSAPHHH